MSSLNNFTPQIGGIIPQLGSPTTGQIYMLQQHTSPFGVQYLLRQPTYNLEASQALQQPQLVQPRIIQPAYQPQQNHTQHQLSLPAPPKPIQVQPQPQSKDQTNAKVRNIKEKCITHYIDGQLIIETSKPLTEKKLKSVKKKKLHLHQHQNQQQQQLQLQLQLQPQQPQVSQPQSHQPAPQLQLQHSLPQQAQQISIQHQHHQSQSHTLQQTIQTSSPQPLRHAPLQPVMKLPQVNSITKQHIIQQLPSPTATQPTRQQQVTKHQSQKSSQRQSNNDQHGNNEILRVRSEMPNWSVAEVVDFIERHEDIRPYSSKFAEDDIDGQALLLMIDRNLNFQILTSMFKHGPAMKIEATLSKYKIND